MLTTIAWLSLTAAVLSAGIITVDLLRGHPQHMWIMDVVWPVTALWAGPVTRFMYFRYGRAGARPAVLAAKARHEKPPGAQQPFGILAVRGSFHCGAGCALGDMLAETLAFRPPTHVVRSRDVRCMAVRFRNRVRLGHRFSVFHHQANARSVARRRSEAGARGGHAFPGRLQVGMYGWMAIATFALFARKLPQNSPTFWFMMQVAMCFGFATSYPVNRWLLRRGIKERM